MLWYGLCGYLHAEIDVTDALHVLLPLAAQWKIIGSLLRISCRTLEAIESDQANVNNCLLAMLQHWSRQIEPPPTRTSLADAVKLLDPKLAESLSSLI